MTRQQEKLNMLDVFKKASVMVMTLLQPMFFDGVYQTQDQIDADAGRIVDFAYRKDTRFLEILAGKT